MSLSVSAVALLLLSPAHAARGVDACERIKPAQALPTETSEALDAMLKVRVVGMGGGEGAVSTAASASYDTSLLAGDDLARAWYTYQLCVLKDTGAITASMHEELMRKAWGLETTPTAAPVATAEGEVGGAAIAATGNMSFLPTAGKATVVLATCSPKNKINYAKPPGHLTWRINGKKSMVLTTTGLAVDVPPGRLSIEGRYRYMTVAAGDAQEMVVEDGKVHYIGVDYDFMMGNVKSMRLRPLSPGEGEAVLSQCDKTTRE